MSLSIFAPLLYLFFGFTVGRIGLDIKGAASAFLTKAVIPLVIIYNIATYRPGVFVVMLGILTIMGIMAALGRLIVRDPIRSLCFFYLNIGWLGLPVATALFGDEAASLFVAAYIASTTFGNSIGAAMLESRAHDRGRVLQLLRSPPVISVFIGIVLLPLGDAIELHFHPMYGVLKFLLGFTGMTILGIWLSSSRIRLTDIKAELLPYLYRSATLFVLLTLFLQVCILQEVVLVTDNMAALYLICLLPPAANIVVLETHYRKTGVSAKIIASGTVISIVAIFFYAWFATAVFPNMLVAYL